MHTPKNIASDFATALASISSFKVDGTYLQAYPVMGIEKIFLDCIRITHRERSWCFQLHTGNNSKEEDELFLEVMTDFLLYLADRDIEPEKTRAYLHDIRVYYLSIQN